MLLENISVIQSNSNYSFIFANGRIIDENETLYQSMKKIKRYIFLLLLFSPLFAFDIYDDLSHSIRNGDAHQLSTFFGNSIDLTILDKENICSKAQAELILKDFFSKNPPKSFNILHKGSSPEGTHYVIGHLITVSGKTFRTSYHFKVNAGKIILLELRLENK